MAEFDPYLQWLGIRDPDRPPNHYRLLGVGAFESDANVIANAADRQMAHVRTFQSSRHADESQRLLNELAAARLCLLHPTKKAAYDTELNARAVANRRPVAAAPLATATKGAESNAARGELFDFAGGGASSRVKRKKKASLAPLAMGASLLVSAAILGVAYYASVSGRNSLAGNGEGSSHAIIGSPSKAVNSSASVQPSPSKVGKKSDNSPNPKSMALTEAPDSADHAATNKAVSPSDSGGDLTGPKTTEATTDAHAGVSAATDSPPVETATEPVLDVDQELTNVRGLLARRDQEGARRLMIRLSGVVVRAQKDRLDLLEKTTSALEKFWDGESEQVDGLSIGDQFELTGATYSVEALLSDAATVKISREGKAVTTLETSLRKSEIDARLAAALTLKEYAGEPSLGAAVAGVFLAIDAQGDQPLAKRLLAEASRGGRKVTVFLALLGPEADAVEPIRPVEPKAVALKLPDLGPKLDRLRKPEPSAEDQKRSKKDIQSLFAEDVAKATTLEQRQKVVEKLLSQADDSANKPADQWALYAAAAEMSSDMGAFSLLMKAIDAKGDRFAIDSFQEKLEALTKIMRRKDQPAEMLFHAIGNQAEAAVAAERFDAAARFLTMQQTVSQKMRDTDLTKAVRSRQKTLSDQNKLYDSALKARQTLGENPRDGEALRTLGRYVALFRGDWELGLPLLAAASGDDPAIKLAQDDLAKPTDPLQQLQLGGAWKGFYATNKPKCEAILDRAAHWIETALPRLSGVDKTRAEKALMELAAARSAEGPQALFKRLTETSWQVKWDTGASRTNDRYYPDGTYTSGGAPYPESRWTLKGDVLTMVNPTLKVKEIFTFHSDGAISGQHFTNDAPEMKGFMTPVPK